MPNAKRTRLLYQYQQLPTPEKVLMQLFSVVYEPIKTNDLCRCANHLPKSIWPQKLTLKTLSSHINTLLKQQLLVKKHSTIFKCHDLVVEPITRELVAEQTFKSFVKAVEAGHPIPYRWKGGPRFIQTLDQLMREVRIGLYSEDYDAIEESLNSFAPFIFFEDDISFLDILCRIVNNPFDAVWFQTLPEHLQLDSLSIILGQSVLGLAEHDDALLLLEDLVEDSPQDSPHRLLLLEQWMYRGRFSEAQDFCSSLPDTDIKSNFLGWLAAVQGHAEQALTYFEASLKLIQKATKKRTVYLEGIEGLLLVLMSLKTRDPRYLKLAKQQIKALIQTNHMLTDIYGMLDIVLNYQSGDLSQKERAMEMLVPPWEAGHAFETLFMAMGRYWIASDETEGLTALLERFLKQAKASHYDWLAVEAAQLLSKLNPDKDYTKTIQALPAAKMVEPLVNIITPVEPWELCLNALSQIHSPESAVVMTSTHRLVWMLTVTSRYWQLQPKEQKINAKGDWTKGRVIALKRLAHSTDEFDYLTEQDRRICNCIETYNTSTYSYYNKLEYKFGEQAIAQLVGHPLVFWEEAPTIRVEVVKGEPEIQVKQASQDSLLIELVPKLTGDGYIVVKETLTRVKVIAIQPEHQRIAAILGTRNWIKVPIAAKEKVLTAINSISNLVTVQSDIGGGNEAIEEVPASATPHLQLLPWGEGLSIKLLSRPFNQVGPYFTPGSGGTTVIAEIDGKRQLTTRNMADEQAQAQQVINRCSVLTDIQPENHEWLIEDPEDCLEVLLAAQSLADQVVIEWPEGEKFKLTNTLSLNSFNMDLRRQRDWFEVEGDVQIDQDQVLNIQQLLQLLDNANGRFLPLGDGQFLALTESFRKRLEELRTIGEKSGNGIRLHPLASLAMEDWVDEVGSLKTDKHWKAHLKRLKDMRTLEPELPSTLQAELRDYQVDGFCWLARLSHWGVGACLADDMGLGKTLQAIALILTRAPQGPTLIIAPTSVGMNWMNEAQRFAPTLNPIQFGTGDRQQLLDSLQPFDMLVCTYGLLQQEEVAQMLADVEWQTIVLDEAQAIKNSATKRSQAAMKLQGGFKLITTGTPIENHLGELWNLFRFITPGLLGSSDRFNQRFANPIEREQDQTAKLQLKKLIQPFILRRTKTQVLDELPSRTEITLYVDLSTEEQALYEVLRQDAIKTLTDSEDKAGAQHLRVLAEIMKLRRCCCNPELVVPKDAVPVKSSKLTLFSEVLEELLSNHHKALVFSQFVDHLAILRKHLDEQKITYQYLDGSTPAKQRKVRVDAFQAGEGDVFLISLKAGGTGLNLTAADYVIHMDPWWNPAVEDQASDRAHRIGQQRPVTIYRLVTRHTIEEKIVDLHRHKRDLADSLLEGADMSGKISTEELLRLIHG